VVLLLNGAQLFADGGFHRNLVLLAVLLVKPVHAPFAVHELLLAREERVARRADLHADGRLGAARLERVAAGARHLRFHILEMNARFPWNGAPEWVLNSHSRKSIVY